MFPLFAARFFKPDDELVSDSPPSIQQSGALEPGPVQISRQAFAAPRPTSLRVLDLQTLPRDDGPPTELRAKKEKLAHFEQQCSHVGDRLYVGGELVAQRLDILRNSSITHVINCVGFLYPPYHQPELTYQTLYLQDSPSEDILSVLYDVFDFIEAAPGPNNRVFIHCSQGVSRSTSLAIAYRMWKESRPFDEVFDEVKKMRGVANPNIGFICQLIQWHRRRTDEAHKPRLYRISPQSASVPQYLVPKKADAGLDPRGAFVVYNGKSDGQVFIWTGVACPSAFEAAAQKFARQLHTYEEASANAVSVKQGQETEAFWAAAERAASSEACCGTPPRSPATPSGSHIKEIRQQRAYNNDYDMYSRSLLPRSMSGGGADSPLNSARSGRKTPRAHEPQASSPNDRLRKQARSEAVERERMMDSLRRSSGTSSSSYGLGSDSARGRALDYQEMAVRRHVPGTAMPLPSPRIGRLGKPPMTPRSAGSNGSSEGPSPSIGATAGPRPVSRLGIPKLALGGVNTGIHAGSPGHMPSTRLQQATEQVKEEDDSTTPSDLTDSDDEENTTATSVSDGGDDEGVAQEEGPAQAQRPAGVPRLNLGLGGK